MLAPCEIINADAFQAYRGMEILSAAPSAEDRQSHVHHLFGHLDPAKENDAAEYSRAARETIGEVSLRAQPLVTGGSGLYLKALTHGLAPTPKGDPLLRAELESLSLDDLVERYRHLDPDGAAAMNLKNRRYVIRNLEICLLAGRPASELKKEWATPAPTLQAVVLQRERSDLDERITRRTQAMFAAGVVAEVARLGVVSVTAEKAIGLREIRSLLRGEITESDCQEAIRVATRRYAKRQETWFRRETAFQTLSVAPAESPEETASRIAERFRLLH